MRYDEIKNAVVIRATELSSFSMRRVSAGGVDALFRQSDAVDLKDASTVPEGTLSYTADTIAGKVEIVSAGTVMVLQSDDLTTVVSVKKVRRTPLRINPTCDPSFFAASVLNALIVSSSRNEKSVRVILKYESAKESVSCEGILNIDFLLKTATAFLTRAGSIISFVRERGTVAKGELSSLKFPYDTVREGQKDLMVETMRTVRTGGKLLACAPTGIGKTVSVLYPVLKSIGAGLADKIFYLTAKGVTGNAAAELIRLLNKDAPHLRCRTLEAKDRLCPTGEVSEGCDGCPLLSELYEKDAYLPVELRLNAAAAEVLSSEPLINRAAVISAAERNSVCPHELFLKISEFCEIVVCDYNYVFDGRIALRRFFGKNGNPDKEQFIFLVDEAHNVPVRVRDTYSAQIRPADFAEVFDLIRSEAVKDEKLEDSFTEVFKSFGEILDECEDSSFLKESEGEEILSGHLSSPDVPVQLTESLKSVMDVCAVYTSKEQDHRAPFRRLRKKIADFLFCAEYSAGASRFLAERENSDLSCSVVCLDPSDIIKNSLRSSHATIMFSATLSPKDYFTEVLGFLDEEYLELDSPYDPSRLCVVICDSVSTKLTDRKRTSSDVAVLIADTICARRGKYIVYFPSYDYMNTVVREFAKTAPDIPAVMQKAGMTGAEKRKFISLFSSDKYSALVGFSVLGGMFSEGIDLSGDALIGVIIVGAGLSGISSSLNMIGEYYEDKYERGYEFAYLYPAVNRIQQAVGRVIRKENDYGVAVLIDSRLAEPSVARLFPASWHPIRLASDTDSLTASLNDFWARFESSVDQY